MALDVMALMEASDSAHGFIGGSFTDELPAVSLSEAAARLQQAILESQMSFLDHRAHMDGVAYNFHNTYIGAVDESVMAQYEILTETGMDELKSRISKFFDRILKFVRSIITKIKIHIDHFTKSNKEMWNKYSKHLQGPGAYAGMTIDGYRFGRGEKYVSSLDGSARYTGSSNGISDLIEKALKRLGISGVVHPAAFTQRLAAIVSEPGSENISYESREQIDKIIDAMKGVTKAERTHAIMCVLCGKNIPKDAWEGYFRQQAWGDKASLKFGEDMFNIKDIQRLMTNADLISDIKADYERVETIIVRFEKELNIEISNLESRVIRTAKSASHAYSIASAYYSVYINILGDAFDAISRLKNIKLTFYNEMLSQARRMFIALAGKLQTPGGSHPTAKRSNEAIDIDPADELDFEL